MSMRRVVLTGFMGSGKSTVGPLLANALGWNFVDTDQQIERSAGATAGILFQQTWGEASFRQYEFSVVSQRPRADGNRDRSRRSRGRPRRPPSPPLRVSRLLDRLSGWSVRHPDCTMSTAGVFGEHNVPPPATKPGSSLAPLRNPTGVEPANRAADHRCVFHRRRRDCSRHHGAVTSRDQVPLAASVATG